MDADKRGVKRPSREDAACIEAEHISADVAVVKASDRHGLMQKV